MYDLWTPTSIVRARLLALAWTWIPRSSSKCSTNPRQPPEHARTVRGPENPWESPRRDDPSTIHWFWTQRSVRQSRVYLVSIPFALQSPITQTTQLKYEFASAAAARSYAGIQTMKLQTPSHATSRILQYTFDRSSSTRLFFTCVPPISLLFMICTCASPPSPSLWNLKSKKTFEAVLFYSHSALFSSYYWFLLFLRGFPKLVITHLFP